MRSVQTFVSSRRHLLLRVAAGIPVLALVGASIVAISSSSARASQSELRPQVISSQNFDAVGLPAGAATGTAARATLPAGLNFRHLHGGPEYVYVISGSFTVLLDDGTTTYNAGDFATVPGARVHTAISPDGAEIFVLNIRPMGADWIIPVQ